MSTSSGVVPGPGLLPTSLALRFVEPPAGTLTQQGRNSPQLPSSAPHNDSDEPDVTQPLIDMKYFPQLMTVIVEYACPSLLQTLRLVSRWTRLEVDARLARHIRQTKERAGTAFLSLRFDATDTPPRIVNERYAAKVVDLDRLALSDWVAWRSMKDREEQRKDAVRWSGERLLVRYHMQRGLSTSGCGYIWRPTQRSVHFVDVTSFFYGLHARSAAYSKHKEEENSTVFHVTYDLSCESSWEFREFGVRRVHNRGLTLVFSRDHRLYPNPNNEAKAYLVILRLLERVVENYAETGDALTLIGVEDWHRDLVPIPRNMDLLSAGWTSRMSRQSQIEWWAAFKAQSVPASSWVKGKRETPQACIRFRTFAKWKEDLGEHLFDLMMDPDAIYWGP